jgi:AcrR family transcriptional regulator
MVTRTPNKRGEGSRLRAEIVAAAARLLERTGNEDAVTLRGVAREAGISAPSIYGHFPDRDAVLDAVIDDGFARLHAALVGAPATPTSRAVRAVVEAYLSFAQEHPGQYRVLFGRSRAADAPSQQADVMDDLHGRDAFGVLADAVASRTGRADTAFRDATAVWVALHGYASLRESVPAFPWPAEQELVATLVERLLPPAPQGPSE